MKLSFFKQFLSGVVLTLVFGGLANGQTIFLEQEGGATDGVRDMPTTGDALNGLSSGTVGVVEVPGLNITIASITGASDAPAIAPAPFFVTDGTRGGIESGNNGTTAAISDEESITFTFDQDIVITEAFFGSLGSFVTPVDSITFGGQLVNDANADSDVFDFTFDGTSPGLAIAAGDPLTITAGDGDVGIRTFTVTVASVPEPSSFALLGLLSLGAVARRRR